jgi:glyoxylase-like metal-dependent hydrolase (beta-lactamase superfamily II)
MTEVKYFAFNDFAENTYVLYDDTKEAIVMDPGCYSVNEKKILKKYINDNQLIVKRLINTHCHLDHVFGIPFVVESFGTGLECHRLEIPMLQRAQVIGDMFGVTVPPLPEPVNFIEDNETVTFGNTELKALLCPGHSPGSLCFYSEKDGFVIGGDVLFFRSIGRTDLPGGNHTQLINSILNRLMVLPDETKVYSGHGQVTTIGYERYNNPFLV